MRPKRLAFLLAAAACQTGTDPNTADVSGRWTFTETLEDRPHGITCADTGIYEITQTGDRFVGRYEQRGLCRTPGGPVDNTDAGTVAGGRVIGRTILFRAGQYCDYDGALDLTTGHITGRALCILVGGGDSITLNGMWSGKRP